jgi:hypothetical protein
VPIKLGGEGWVNNVNIYIAVIVILFIGLVLAFRLSLYLAKRSVCKVITIFRENDAVEPQKALTLESLGLGPKSLFQIRLLRDYKPWALQTLVQAGVIRLSTEGTFYLSEETLKANPNINSACQIR